MIRREEVLAGQSLGRFCAVLAVAGVIGFGATIWFVVSRFVK